MKKGGGTAGPSPNANGVFARHIHSLRKSTRGELWQVLLVMVEQSVWKAPTPLRRVYEADPLRAEKELLQKYRMIYLARHADDALTQALSNHASRKRGAAQRLANDRDGKRSAKEKAFKLWRERRAGKHPKLRTNEQFAMECMRRWRVLTSARVITGWCTAWNKEAQKT